MKAKFTAAIILSAMLLAACNSGNQSADNIPAETEGTETVSQTVTEASKTETEPPETTTATSTPTRRTTRVACAPDFAMRGQMVVASAKDDLCKRRNTSLVKA